MDKITYDTFMINRSSRINDTMFSYSYIRLNYSSLHNYRSVAYLCGVGNHSIWMNSDSIRNLITL